MLALFAVDAFGGFVVQSFLAYWFALRFDASPQALGVLFFAAGLIQTDSLMAAPRLAERFGLLNTMVFTHLPSNLPLAVIPFTPTFSVAATVVLCRQALSQVDVPTRRPT